MKKSPWSWVPTLYFAEGIPYVVVMSVAVVMYKRFGISNTDIALYTSWLYLPWVIKPFWSPFVDLVRTKRWWIVAMQMLVGGGLAAVALLLPTPVYFKASLAVFWMMAFASATHDIAADGYYMLALSQGDQSFFVGIRSTFYRLAMIAGQGALVMLAGFFERRLRLPVAWTVTIFIVAALFIALSLYHAVVLPRPEADHEPDSGAPTLGSVARGFVQTFASFFRKPGIALALAFMLTYRLSEAMLVKMTSPFLLDTRDVGGLGLSTSQVGFVYGTIGVIFLTLGGIIGGIVVSKGGLRRWIWPMALAITLPNAVYLYLAWAMPDSFLSVNVAVAIEQFGYGFGFTAYMLYLIFFSDGESKTAHYALCSGFMALGMMLPGMAAGWIQEHVGYTMFFVIVMICVIPTLVVVPFLKIPAGFGKK